MFRKACTSHSENVLAKAVDKQVTFDKRAVKHVHDLIADALLSVLIVGDTPQRTDSRRTDQPVMPTAKMTASAA